MTANDWLGLADTLAYELDETAEKWAAMIEQIIETIGKIGE